MIDVKNRILKNAMLCCDDQIKSRQSHLTLTEKSGTTVTIV